MVTNLKRPVVLFLIAVALAGLLYVVFVARPYALRGKVDLDARQASQVGLPEFVHSKPDLQAISSIGGVRKAYLNATDLKELYDRLMQSDEPGATLYAVQARGECTLMGMQFGSGTDAWNKFHSTVAQDAPDRAARVKLFADLQSRCRGFSEDKVRAAFEVIKTAVTGASNDPYLALAAEFRAIEDRRGVATPERMKDAVQRAVASQDPELLEAAGGAIATASNAHTSKVPAMEADLSSRLAWAIAIENATGSSPQSLRAARTASCLIGKGCDTVSASEAARRTLWDRPASQADAIMRSANALSPKIEDALRSGDVASLLSMK